MFLSCLMEKSGLRFASIIGDVMSQCLPMRISTKTWILVKKRALKYLT